LLNYNEIYSLLCLLFFDFITFEMFRLLIQFFLIFALINLQILMKELDFNFKSTFWKS